ncbi:MAG TPA: tetratricopeptide repeat protein, partial [Nannocystaceae bacterium]|nr:tetratricopeptide repeat protein [Nannocystaceae bacterium]
RALAIDERALGADHSEVGWDLNALAAAYNALGRHAEAQRAAERAVVIRERLGPSPDRVGQARFQLARALAGQGHVAEARASATVAIAEYASEPHNQTMIREWLASLPQ